MDKAKLPILIQGTQTKGLGLGSNAIFPTINIHTHASLERLPQGVYAGYTTLRYADTDKRFISAIHIGPKPTVYVHTVSVETHIIDPLILEPGYNTDKILLTLMHRIRNTQTFSDTLTLKRQIESDIHQIRVWFATHKEESLFPV